MTVSPALLLDLPNDELSCVVAHVDVEGKTSLRITCRRLRDIVESIAQYMTLYRIGHRRIPNQALNSHLLIMRLPNLTVINISASSVRDLGPLALCRTLRTLLCDNTFVSSLDPLAECTALTVLCCCDTAIASLEPLAACRLLTTLNGSNIAISSLDPLAKLYSAVNPPLRHHRSQQPRSADRMHSTDQPRLQCHRHR